MSKDISISTPLAPEDVRPGDYVSLLHIVSEYLWFRCDDWRDEGLTVQRLQRTPPVCLGPMKVLDVCLPFVFVKLPDARLATLDVRLHRLARLDAGYGRSAWKQLRETARSRKSRGERSRWDPSEF